MIPFLEFRIAPMNRDAGLAEKLAGVPEGTYVAFAEAIEEIAGQELDDVLPVERQSVIEEQFNLMRVDADIRRYHDFSQNWFGKPTAETVMLLSRWKFVENGVLTPGSVREASKVESIMRTQGITIPEGLKTGKIGGIEWNERLALQIGRLRENTR